MIEALLRGKLSREQENMEDVLTSRLTQPVTSPTAGCAINPAMDSAWPTIWVWLGDEARCTGEAISLGQL